VQCSKLLIRHWPSQIPLSFTLVILFSLFGVIHVSFLASGFYETSYSAYDYSMLDILMFIFTMKFIFIQTKEGKDHSFIFFQSPYTVIHRKGQGRIHLPKLQTTQLFYIHS
jgi:hypothetical protein